MNREDYIDLYFEETDLGPRWRLRESFGAAMPAAEAPPPVAPKAAAAPAPRDARADDEEAYRRSFDEDYRRLPDDDAQRSSHEDSIQSSHGDSLRSSHGDSFPSPQRDSFQSQKKPANATLPRRELRPAAGAAPAAATARPSAGTVPVGDVQQLGWDELESSIRACKACGLCRQRRQAVPGVGDRQADWLFVGEGPGAEEDQQGEPFVGQAGKLLDNMLLAIGLKRGENVYIANAVKCRPPNNRTPEAPEMAACRPYLERQIALLQPKLIVVLGRAAAHSVLGSDDALGSLRGRLHRYGEIPVVVTYHPAYLLRTLQDKAKAWEDLCLARRTMRGLSE